VKRLSCLRFPLAFDSANEDRVAGCFSFNAWRIAGVELLVPDLERGCTLSTEMAMGPLSVSMVATLRNRIVGINLSSLAAEIAVV
jgi:hypothetical protein